MTLSVFSVQTILLEKIKIRYKGEQYYRNNSGSFKSVTKKRRSLHMMNPEVNGAGNCVNPKEMKDIHKLL
jgi:hypothetical protein